MPTSPSILSLVLTQSLDRTETDTSTSLQLVEICHLFCVHKAMLQHLWKPHPQTPPPQMELHPLHKCPLSLCLVLALRVLLYLLLAGEVNKLQVQTMLKVLEALQTAIIIMISVCCVIKSYYAKIYNVIKF